MFECFQSLKPLPMNTCFACLRNTSLYTENSKDNQFLPSSVTNFVRDFRSSDVEKKNSGLEKERAVKFTAEDRPVFRFFRLGLHVLKFRAAINTLEPGH